MAGVEVALAALVVVLDLAVPTLVVLAVAGVSLAVRRRGPSSLGFHRLRAPLRVSGAVLVLTVGWTLLQFGLLIPVLDRLTGTRQDLSAFADLQGNATLLLVLLLASWTLGLAEETVFRGYLPTRLRELIGPSDLRGLAGAATVIVPAVLFALIHVEQGVVGLIVTFLDALFFTWLRARYRNLWAPVLAHGFNNSIGFCTFFLIGPVHALW